jgi:hypothetical protein
MGERVRFDTTTCRKLGGLEAVQTSTKPPSGGGQECCLVFGTRRTDVVSHPTTRPKWQSTKPWRQHRRQYGRAETSELVALASLDHRAAGASSSSGTQRWSGLSPTPTASARRTRPDASQVTWLLLTQHLASLVHAERLGVWLLRTATCEAYRMRRLRGGEVPAASEHDPEQQQRHDVRHEVAVVDDLACVSCQPNVGWAAPALTRG